MIHPTDIHPPEAPAPATDELKARARLLHRRVKAGEPTALARVGQLPEFRGQSPDFGEIQRKHCLSTVSREFGFKGWPHARRLLEGATDETDFGTLLYPNGCSAFTNEWFVDYEQARAARQRSDGFLLAYRTHFFVVSALYIESLGLDPNDPAWDAIGRDWVRPTAPAARTQLYAKLLAGRPREAA